MDTHRMTATIVWLNGRTVCLHGRLGVVVVSIQDGLTTDVTLSQGDVRNNVTNEADAVHPRVRQSPRLCENVDNYWMALALEEPAKPWT
jgi:hypothetical protein